MLWTELNRYGGGFDPWSPLDWLAGQADRGFTVPTRTNEFPSVNIWANADKAILTTEIPGIDPKSVEISVAGKTVSLRGSREIEQADEGKTYHRQERWSGQFSKTIELPFTIEAEQVEAHFSKGVLKITLPKAQAEKPRTITVKSE